MSKGVINVMFDIEADGQSFLSNNMINIGVVITDDNENILGEFNGDLEPLDHHVSEQATMDEFWDKNDNNRAELKRIRENERPAIDVIRDLFDFVYNTANGRKIKWIARPAAWDWPWLKYYHQLYVREYMDEAKPIEFKATCLSSMEYAYIIATNKNKEDMKVMWKEWGEGLKMTHNGLNDARLQSKVFHGIKRELALLPLLSTGLPKVRQIEDRNPRKAITLTTVLMIGSWLLMFALTRQ